MYLRYYKPDFRQDLRWKLHTCKWNFDCKLFSCDPYYRNMSTPASRNIAISFDKSHYLSSHFSVTSAWFRTCNCQLTVLCMWWHMQLKPQSLFFSNRNRDSTKLPKSFLEHISLFSKWFSSTTTSLISFERVVMKRLVKVCTFQTASFLFLVSKSY